MKKRLLLVLLLTIMGSQVQARKNSADSCDFEATSKSYLAIQPHFQSQSPEMLTGFRNDFMHARDEGKGGAFQFVIFGSGSTNDKDLARYFFPEGKESLIVGEFLTPESFLNAEEHDLMAQHFNVATVNGTFRSKISIAPKQTVIGAGLHYKQSFKRNEERGRGFWFSASAPIIRVKNDLNFKETVLDDGGGAREDATENIVGTMKEAFKQKAWKFGKITNKSMTETKLADIELKLGYEWLQHSPCHMESYLGVAIPTGNTPEGKFVFEPIVGRGKHVAVQFGSSLGMELWANEEEDRVLRYELSNHTEYQFRKEQVRSFDLKHKPWSRYIEVYANEEQAQEAARLAADPNPFPAIFLQTPGINVFTQKVDVTPGIVHNVNTGFVFTCKKFQGELGYNFLAKRSECVKLAKPWKEGPAIKNDGGAGQTNPIRDITGNKFLEQFVTTTTQAIAPDGVQPGDTVDLNPADVLIPVTVANFQTSIIKETDLDLQSAATPCMLAHTLYASLGMRCDAREYPLLANLGASYTFSQNNNAVVRRWTVWGKFGFGF